MKWATLGKIHIPNPPHPVSSSLANQLQGVNNDTILKTVQDYYKRHLGNLDGICVLEKKLRGNKFSRLPSLFLRGATFIECEAKDVYNFSFFFHIDIEVEYTHAKV